MNIEGLTREGITNTLICIHAMWTSGNVKSEEAGAALAQLRGVYEAALKKPEEIKKAE